MKSSRQAISTQTREREFDQKGEYLLLDSHVPPLVRSKTRGFEVKGFKHTETRKRVMKRKQLFFLPPLPQRSSPLVSASTAKLLPSSSCHVSALPFRLRFRTWGWAVLRLSMKATCKPQISPYRFVQGHRVHDLCRLDRLVSMSVTCKWQMAFRSFVSCVDGCRCSIRIDTGFKSCDCPTGGLTSVSVVFAIHAFVVVLLEPSISSRLSFKNCQEHQGLCSFS